MIVIMSENLIKELIVQADKRWTLDRGAYLFHQGDPVKSVFIVEEGLVELTRNQPGGGSIILQRATGKSILAEASMYSQVYHCDAVVALTVCVCTVPKAGFLERIKMDDAFSTSWAAHLASEVQSARYRSEILSRKTVADRFDGWLAWQGNELPEKGTLKSIAAQIGVSPEAFYRELARRRRQ